jgi:hypothetical protein
MLRFKSSSCETRVAVVSFPQRTLSTIELLTVIEDKRQDMLDAAQKKRSEGNLLVDCISEEMVTIELDMRIRYMNRAIPVSSVRAPLTRGLRGSLS